MALEVLPNGSLIDDGDNKPPVFGSLTKAETDALACDIAFARLVGQVRENLGRTNDPETMDDPEKIIPVTEIAA